MTAEGRATTLEEIEAIPGATLYPADVVAYLRTTEQSINCAAKAGRLPWAYKLGARTVIPKESFVNCHRYGIPTINELHRNP